MITGEYRRCDAGLIGVCAEHVGCQSYFMGKPTDKVVHYVVVGFADDIQDALLLAATLQVQAQRLGAAWIKAWRVDNKAATGMQRFVARRSFLYGFADTVAARLLARREAAAQEHEAGASSVALAIRDKASEVDAEMASLGLKEFSFRQKWNMAALSNGRLAGHEADLDPGVGGANRKEVGR